MTCEVEFLLLLCHTLAAMAWMEVSHNSIKGLGLNSVICGSASKGKVIISEVGIEL
jgi:hypothetical protein